ncbi:hypothetical protein [uncultured Secundilactobacillus sp.]|uniref:hypothetical protein n=1 Tax=uncultured Secundilactobacillus sp. TaxID=2813935 RepID=UPI0025832ED4|nr:hypothetical protein [uncultured Secundilactobacillus sp.]
MSQEDRKQFIIRGLRKIELEELKDYAVSCHYDSVNAFLLALIRDELSKQMMLRYGDRTLQYLETNATVMNNMIDSYNSFIGGNEELLDQVKQLVALLKE